MPSAMGWLVPLDNENRWSDLLALLAVNDPRCAAAAFGLGQVDGRSVTVEREVSAARGADRVDMLVRVDGELRTVVEAKVLSGLGVRQLDRYAASFPGAADYLVVSPARLPVHPAGAAGWRAVSWESLLTPFTHSTNAWVAETAVSWLDYLQQAMPELSADLRWNDLRDGEGFAASMRARMSWVYERLRVPAPLTSDLVASGGGKAWVARMYAPAAKPGFDIAAEAEERTARTWPPIADASQPCPLRGPQVWVGLRQGGVTSSAGFDWDYLAEIWAAIKPHRNDWITTRPALVAEIDKQNWQRIGCPVGLGYGYGNREATKRGACMFGAKIQLPADIRLADLVEELRHVAALISPFACT